MICFYDTEDVLSFAKYMSDADIVDCAFEGQWDIFNEYF